MPGRCKCLGTKNRHGPFFGCCPRGVQLRVVGRTRRGLWLRCRAGGAAGLLCRAGMWRARCRSRWASHVMQKPCKNHAKTMQNAARAERQPAEPSLSPGYISQGDPLNIHSPRVPCYMCYMCYISQGNPEHPLSPGSLLYVLYVLYLTRQARVLARCAICAVWPYIAHILQIFARTEYIAHIVHIARSWGRVGVQRLGV